MATAIPHRWLQSWSANAAGRRISLIQPTSRHGAMGKVTSGLPVPGTDCNASATERAAAAVEQAVLVFEQDVSIPTHSAEWVQRREIYSNLTVLARQLPDVADHCAPRASEPWQVFVRSRLPLREPPGVCVAATGSRNLVQTMSGSRRSNSGCAPWMRTYLWRGSARR